MKNIGIYGDSVMKGIILDSESKRYSVMPPDNAKRLEEKYGLSIDNRSQMGSTLGKVYPRIVYDVEHGVDFDTVLIEYGGNDCDFDWEEIAREPDCEHIPKTKLCDFKKKLTSLVELFSQNKVQPILMTLPPLHAARFFDWVSRNGASKENIVRWLGGDIQLIYRFQELYSNAVSAVAIKTGAMLIDVRSYFLDRHDYHKLICDDGIHPSVEGHKLIGKAFDDALASLAASHQS